MNDIDFFDDDDNQPVDNRFRIETLDQAEWAMRKTARAEKEIARFEEMAQKLKAQIDARLEKIKHPHINTIEYMTTLLEPWVSMEIAKQGKKKSYNLLSGKAGYRTSPQSIDVIDEDAAIAWVEEHKALACIKTKKTIIKNEVKALIKEKGEIPTGIEVHGESQTFYVDTKIDLIEE